jgi:type III secretion protein J
MPSDAARRHIVAVFALLGVCGCQVEILHDISESEANQVVAALQRSGLSAHKERIEQGSGATYTISVNRSDAPTAWSVLRQKNLPRPKEQGLGEVFGEVGLVPTRTQERALLRHALAGEVARTLNSIDGVRQARVHIVLPERDPLAASPSERSPRPRASVLLKVDTSVVLSENDVQRIVAGSVERLTPDAVNVVFSRSEAPQTSSSPDHAAPTVALGPFRVAQRSKTPLTIALVLAVALIVGLALALVLLVRRNRVLSRTVATSRRAGASAGSPEASLQLLEQSIVRRSSTRK